MASIQPSAGVGVVGWHADSGEEIGNWTAMTRAFHEAQARIRALEA